ncbi:hypothetical protein OHA98_41370 [Streptomyces sp. NBC_00654]|uniref:hypothetical protein n=1 Tax=Streptomyces sp. NBC_00654 TaxID=2975799 RepID=UPI002257957D|nr:hypothetical protein [Streptomyces sp. NBC_00654]MCX4971064.1 hypothetical protein [Streptomyces sp. NBC_00654]
MSAWASATSPIAEWATARASGAPAVAKQGADLEVLMFYAAVEAIEPSAGSPGIGASSPERTTSTSRASTAASSTTRPSA